MQIIINLHVPDYISYIFLVKCIRDFRSLQTVRMCLFGSFSLYVKFNNLPLQSETIREQEANSVKSVGELRNSASLHTCRALTLTAAPSAAPATTALTLQ